MAFNVLNLRTNHAFDRRWRQRTTIQFCTIAGSILAKLAIIFRKAKPSLAYSTRRPCPKSNGGKDRGRMAGTYLDLLLTIVQVNPERKA